MSEDGTSLILSGQENVPLGGTLCLLSCCIEGIRRLSLRNGALIGGESVGGGSVAAVQISENEIAEVSMSTNPIVYNVTNGQEIATLSREEQAWSADGLNGVAFLPLSQLLVTAGDDKMVVVWNRHQKQKKAVVTSGGGEEVMEERKSGDPPPPFTFKCQLEGHTNWVKILDAWGREEEPNRNIVVSGSNDKTARVWDVLREECVSVLRGHRGWVGGLCHDSEKQIQFTGSSDKTVIAWDFRVSPQHQKIVQMKVPNRVRTLCYRPKHSQLVIPCFSGPVQVIDIRMLRSDNPTTSVIHEWNAGHSGSVYGSCDVDDDNWNYFVTSGFDDKRVKAWKENGKCRWEATSDTNPWGNHPFIRGDPCVGFEPVASDGSHRAKCQFLTQVGAFSMRIRLAVSSTEMGFWKWVLIL